jgi:membrane associated rhomboid family serine protease
MRCFAEIVAQQFREPVNYDLNSKSNLAAYLTAMNITLFIVIITSAISFLAFSNHKIFDELVFWPYCVWRNKEWYRLLSCSFIHADLSHLLFNMIALFSFGQVVESYFNELFSGAGHTLYILMYFGAVATADLYNLFKRRDDYNYRSLGASGGVSAIVFAAILFDPFSKIMIFFIPIGIPAFVFGGLYLVYCAYMARRGGDNIGHLAHLTGSVFGFFFPVILKPVLLTNFITMLMHGR